ncbi:hypothetical protein [Methylocaldum szegediense]|jgi:hypothetical protein|uniref:Transposase n=1 Tax=Methylocaldum szegediense TaxID=73780 RepID=A0ABM9I747_9GAMM|nr:hypothetical protein [Methylocaldum szegediense]CAI8934754.1 protein of unknown function [Methylocaldum szegediense]
MPNAERDDYDSPWKEALENRFPEFMALLFPAIHAEVDWHRDQIFLDKECNRWYRTRNRDGAMRTSW